MVAEAIDMSNPSITDSIHSKVATVLRIYLLGLLCAVELASAVSVCSSTGTWIGENDLQQKILERWRITSSRRKHIYKQINMKLRNVNNSKPTLECGGVSFLVSVEVYAENSFFLLGLGLL